MQTHLMQVVPFGACQMFHQRRDAFGEVRQRPGSAQKRLHAGIGVPPYIAPHLLQEDVRVICLSPVQYIIERGHLLVVPVEDIPLGFVHAGAQFDPEKREAQPGGMAIDLTPGRSICDGRIPTPGAPPRIWDAKGPGVFGALVDGVFADGVP